MNKKYYFLILLLIFSGVAVSSCSSNDDDLNPTKIEDSYDYSKIIETYVNKTVIPTYNHLKSSAGELYTNSQYLKDNKTQEALNKACQIWVKSRISWEASEAFLFGPAADFNIDPSLDSWPLDLSELNNVLNSNDKITKDYLLEYKGPGIRGFHTSEYLLFRDGKPRNVSELTDRELEYLVVVTEIIKDDTESLYNAWISSYGTEFLNAGKSGSRFISQEAAIDQIINGLIVIADEVGTGKLVDPFEAKNPLLVESWYSWNSLVDFQNNIKGIENVYKGGFDENDRGMGLEKFVESKNPVLNARIKAEILDAYNKIGAIPSPFRNNLDKAESINSAINACLKLRDTLQKDVLGLVLK